MRNIFLINCGFELLQCGGTCNIWNNRSAPPLPSLFQKPDILLLESSQTLFSPRKMSTELILPSLKSSNIVHKFKNFFHPQGYEMHANQIMYVMEQERCGNFLSVTQRWDTLQNNLNVGKNYKSCNSGFLSIVNYNDIFSRKSLPAFVNALYFT